MSGRIDFKERNIKCSNKVPLKPYEKRLKLFLEANKDKYDHQRY